jgi:acetyl-CoA carboxylase biotin carboxyl carrier protein
LPLDDAGTSTDHAQPIQVLIDLLKQNNLIELEVEREGVRIRLRRESALSPTALVRSDTASPAHEAPAEKLDVSVAGDMVGKITITSPIVGTFYRSPSPDADPYVEEGDLVKKGQVLCIVEAMKLMNEIESEMDGRIVKILAESTKPVEYGQPLFLIDPAPAS